jgi:hypothetical protein
MFLASQKYKALENNARSNIFFFATYWDSAIAVRKAIWQEQFSSCFEKYEDFEMIFKTVCCPEPREGEAFARPRCLIVDKRFSSSNPNECCFYFEPQFDLPPFSVGSRDYLLIGWYMSKQTTLRSEDVTEQIDSKVRQILYGIEGGGRDDSRDDAVVERVVRGRNNKKKQGNIRQVNLQKSSHDMPIHSSRRQ